MARCNSFASPSGQRCRWPTLRPSRCGARPPNSGRPGRRGREGRRREALRSGGMIAGSAFWCPGCRDAVAWPYRPPVTGPPVRPFRLPPARLFCRRFPAHRPWSASGTSEPAPDSAHLAAGERRAPPSGTARLTELAPAGYAVAGGDRGRPSGRARNPRRLWRWSRSRRTLGTWGGNLLGLAPSAAPGDQGRRNHPQLPAAAAAGVAPHGPALQAGRSGAVPPPLPRRGSRRSSSSSRSWSRATPRQRSWARGNIREAASAALAEAGYAEDPRLRGAGHKIANSISQFLRSPLAEKPFVKSGKQLALHPEAHPPSWYSVAMLAAMPNLQRERAGFTERLGHYLAQPAPKKAFVIQVGKRTDQAAAPAAGRSDRGRR